jgi:hypothetical protein
MAYGMVSTVLFTMLKKTIMTIIKNSGETVNAFC